MTIIKNIIYYIIIMDYNITQFIPIFLRQSGYIYIYINLKIHNVSIEITITEISNNLDIINLTF